MSAAEQKELIETLIWSDGDYKFEELVASFELPQLVRVEVGFCTVDGRTGLASDQVIMLHCVRKTKKLICETRLKNAVLVPLDCPLGVLVQPRANECKQVSAGQLASLRAKYDNIKYVFALEGHLNLESPTETLEMGEIFELGDVDTRDCSVKCKNVATGKSVSIKPDFNVLFAPLLDCKRHTLAEVKQTFGFPAHVYFMNENSVGVPTSSCRNSSMSVSMLDAVTVVDEIEQAVVIATTVGNGADSVCLRIPNVLPMQVAVAKGFIPGKEHNWLIVETLKKQFNSSMALQSSQNLDMYEDLDAASNTIQEMSFKQPPFEIQISEFDYGPAPTLSPRRVSQNETSTPQVSGGRQMPPVSSKPRPIIPTPRPTPQPKPKPAQPTEPKRRSSERKSNSTVPRMGKLPQTNAKATTLSMARKWDSDYDYTFSPPQDTLIEGQHICEKIPYKSPTLSPRRVSQNETSTPQVSGGRHVPPVSTKPRPIIPTPRPTPQPKPKPAQPTEPKRSSERESNSTMPRMGQLPQTKMPGVDEKYGYVQFNAKATTLDMARKSDSDYDYTFSPPQDTPIEGQHIYERIPYQSKVAPNPLDASVHTVCPPRGGPKARFPRDLSGLSVSQIAELLSELNMACYKEVFEREFIDGEMLKSLDGESLKSLGVNAFHVTKLTRFIDGWRPNF